MIPPHLLANLPDVDRAPDLSFFVPGKAAPGGSKGGFGFQRANGSIGVRIVDSGKNNKEWRGVVAHHGREAMLTRASVRIEEHGLDDGLFTGALSIRCVFVRVRPKNHFNSKGLVKPSAPKLPLGKPDATKLFRALEDALKQILWTDDSLICGQRVYKVYGATPGAHVEIWKGER